MDNGSTPPLRDYPFLGTTLKGVTLIESRINLGFAGGMNLGLKSISAVTCDAVLLLNNDTTVDDALLRELSNYRRLSPNRLIIGTCISKQKHWVFGYRYFKYLSLALPILGDSKNGMAEEMLLRKLDYIDGAAMLIDAKALYQIGGLPEKNFLYFEELNLIRELKAENRLGICQEAVVHHQGGQSTSHLGVKLRTYHSTLAAFRYTYDCQGLALTTVILARCTAALLRDFRTLTFSHTRGTLSAMRTFLKEIRDE